MKVGFIGCVQSSSRALNLLLQLEPGLVEIVGVVTKKSSEINADFVDLGPICEANDIPYHYEVAKERDKSIDFMRELKPDVIYCFGWSYLLPEELMKIPPLGIIGFHPAKLPQNRGRHPIIWALALGLSETASSFFRIDKGTDSGPLISQEIIKIHPHDNASTLYKKILNASDIQIRRFTRELANGSAYFREQNHADANYWRKRNRDDGRIDWRMGAGDIHNLIRALHKPYPGAEYHVGDLVVKAWKSSVSEAKHPTNIEPGRVLEVVGSRVLVKCAHESAIWLEEFEPQIALHRWQCL